MFNKDKHIKDSFVKAHGTGRGLYAGDHPPGGVYPDGAVRQWEIGDVVKKDGKWELLNIPSNVEGFAAEAEMWARKIRYLKEPLVSANQILNFIIKKHIPGTEVNYLVEDSLFWEKEDRRIEAMNFHIGDGLKRIWVMRYVREVPTMNIEEYVNFNNDLEVFYKKLINPLADLVPSQREYWDKIWEELDKMDQVYQPLEFVQGLKDQITEDYSTGLFSQDFVLSKTLELKLREKYKNYLEVFKDSIYREQLEKQRIEVGIDEDDFQGTIWNKILKGFYDGKRVFELAKKRIEDMGVELTGDWENEAGLLIMRNFEILIHFHIPYEHFLVVYPLSKTDYLVKRLENKDYSSYGGDREAYAFLTPKNKSITFSTAAQKELVEIQGRVYLKGNILQPDIFNSVLTHEIGHAIYDKLEKVDNWFKKRHNMLCGWDNRQTPFEATGEQASIKRLGRNQDIPLISEYATKSAGESFAEYYAFYLLNKNTIDNWLDTKDDSLLQAFSERSSEDIVSYEVVGGKKKKIVTSIPYIKKGLYHSRNIVDYRIIKKNKEILRNMRDNICRNIKMGVQK